MSATQEAAASNGPRHFPGFQFTINKTDWPGAGENWSSQGASIMA